MRVRTVGAVVVSGLVLAGVVPVAAPASAASVTARLVRTVDTAAFLPAAPDPSGIVYLPESDRLMISDAEVDEVPLYAGVNLYETTRAGVLTGTGLTRPQTKEPAGVAYGAGRLFVADDDQQRIHEFTAGADGRFGTPDDVRRSFGTGAFGSTDPEDVAYFPPTGELFVLDGADNDVHRVTPGPDGIFDGVAPGGDDTLAEFDLLGFGTPDPEGIGFHPQRGTLLVVDNATATVLELNRQLQLVNRIDIKASGQVKAAGITVAPGSADPSRQNLYLVDRGLDNDAHPGENDGKLYEMAVDLPPIGNLAPVAVAGRDLGTAVGTPVTLAGSVRDDGLPAAVAAAWTVVSGPGAVTFGSAGSATTTARFSAPGSYTLRLTGSDTSLSGFDDVAVTVVAAGAPIPVAVPVAKAFDDVEEPIGGTWVDWLSSSLNLPNAGTTRQAVGLRFDDVPLPAGATVTSASVQFTSKKVSSAAASVSIAGVAADDTPTFATVPGDVTTRPRTSATATWAPPAWTNGAAGPAQRTPDLSAVVQSVVGRPGWAPGNALAFVMTGTGERVAASHDGGGAGPVLHLTYTVGPVAPPVSFVGAAASNANTTSAAVTVPATVRAGDELVLFATLNSSTVALTPPAGWTQLADVPVSSARTLAWRRTALATDAGSVVRLGAAALVKADLQVAAYRGATVLGTRTSSDAAYVTSHPSPGPASGWAVTYWGDKSSSTTDWTPPTGVSVRGESLGSGSGRTSSLLVDSAGTASPAAPSAATDAPSRAASLTLTLG